MTPDAPVANTAQAAYWNEGAGDTWASLQADLDRQIEPLGELAIDALGPRSGERVLDVGCGCGQTTLELARRVGPTGAVLGLDLSRPMLAVARRRADETGVAQAAFVEGDAQVHPLEAGAYDGLFSRFGVMFFADPPAAFTNLRAALRPGGRLSFVCWRRFDENPWMTVPVMAALEHLPPMPPPDPTAPGPFAFADPERVRAILSAAGFADIQIRGHDQDLGGGGLEEAVNLSLRLGPLGARLREQPHLAQTVVGSIREALSGHLRDGRVMLPSATWMVTAANPAA